MIQQMRYMHGIAKSDRTIECSDLRTYRLRVGITTAELARRLGGVNIAWLEQVEVGAVWPSRELLELIITQTEFHVSEFDMRRRREQWLREVRGPQLARQLPWAM